MTTYTITPRDYQYLQAMLTHEGQNTILNDINKGNTNSAYGQMTGLVETWLNRAMARGTDVPTQMLLPNQLSFFSKDPSVAAKEASQLDPRIGQMLDTYLHSRDAGDSGIMGSVNQYLNRELTDALYSQGYRKWYDKSDLLGAFGDARKGGTSSLQQEFLNNKADYTVPQYDVRVDPSLRLNPTEGDVDALTDFRNSYRLPTPLPPARPTDGSNGITNQPPDSGLVAGLNDFSDRLTGGLENVGDAIRSEYQSALGRMPSAGEVQPWVDAIGKGATSLYDVLKGIATGGEAQQRGQQTGIDPSIYIPNQANFSGLNVSGNVGFGSLPSVTLPGMDVAQTIGPGQAALPVDPTLSAGSNEANQIYLANLGRPAEADVLRAYSGEANGSALLGQLAANVYGSTEANTYRGSLAPDLATQIAPQNARLFGAPSAVATLGPGLSVQATDGGSPLSPGAAEVDQIYRANLGRPAEAAVLQAYGNEANGSSLLGQLAAKVYGSDEAGAYRGRLAPEQAAQIQAQNATMFGAPLAVSTISAGPAVQATDGGTAPLSPGASAANDIYLRNLGRPAEAAVLQAYSGEANGSNALGQLSANVYNSNEAGAYRGRLSPDLAALIQPANAQMYGAPAATPTIGAGNALTPLPPGFDDAAYLLANPDVAIQHINPEEHYRLFGGREGRALAPEGYAPTLAPQMASTIGAPGLTPTIGAPSAVHGFDPAQYLQANPDVARSGMDPITHYEKFGFGENRAIDLAGDRLSQNFDGGAYLAQNPDVAMAGFNPLDHFIRLGGNEGRSYNTGLSPFDFSSFNMGGGLGAGPQSMSSAYGVTPTPAAPAVSNLGFSGLDASAGLGGGLGSFGSSFGITPNSFSIGSPSASSMGTSGMGASGGIGQGQGIDAIGAPALSVVGGYLGNVRSDGTTSGKSLAQTNAEFNAITQKTLADAAAGTARLNNLANNLGPSSNIGATTTLSSYASPMRWL